MVRVADLGLASLHDSFYEFCMQLSMTCKHGPGSRSGGQVSSLSSINETAQMGASSEGLIDRQVAVQVSLNQACERHAKLEARGDLGLRPLHHPLLVGQYSALAPPRTLDWLRPDYDLSNFESPISAPGPWPAPWSRGIARINIEALRQTGIQPIWQIALSRGLDLGLTSLPPSQQHPPENYSSVLGFGSLVEEKLQADIDKGVLEVISAEELADPTAKFWFHPLGAVPKGDIDCRIIVDSKATGLNAVIRDTIMALHSVRTVIGACKLGSYGCSFDKKAGFNQLLLRQGAVNFVCVTTPSGRKCRYRFLCFGLKCAPFLFQGTMMELRRMLVENGIVDCFISVYIDDWTLVDVCRFRLEANRLRFKSQIMEWGFVLHDEKESLPSQVFDCVGYTVDTVGLRLFLSEQKCLKKLGALDSFLRQAEEAGWKVPIYVFESLLGKLSHAASVMYGGRWHLRPMWKVRSRIEAAQAKALAGGKQCSRQCSKLVDLRTPSIRCPRGVGLVEGGLAGRSFRGQATFCEA